MTLKKSEYTVNWKTKHDIAVYGEGDVEEAMGLSQERLQNECKNTFLSLFIHEGLQIYFR